MLRSCLECARLLRFACNDNAKPGRNADALPDHRGQKTDAAYRRGKRRGRPVSCDPEPPLGSILYMTEVPPEGGDTLFASMYAAYDKLSPPIQRLVEGLTAIHDGEPVYRGRFGYGPREGGFPKAEHPVVRTHPVTGRKALFVNRNFTTGLKGLSRIESDALLELLYRHAETPEFQCRFRW